MSGFLGLIVQAITLILVVKITFNDLRHIDLRLGELERIMKRPDFGKR